MIRRVLLLAFVCIWLAAVATGMGWLWSYNQAAGAPATPPERWPDKAAVSLATDKFTLILLAHPQCPCTQATIEELSKLMTNCNGRINAYVLFAIPQGVPDDWYHTDLWRSAALIPGVKTLVDHDGTEAIRFQAYTSGQVVLYDRQGELRFRGGITQSRGHEGDNAGRAAIEAIVNTGNSDTDHTAVFGCPLFNPESECRVPNHGNNSKQE